MMRGWICRNVLLPQGQMQLSGGRCKPLATWTFLYKSHVSNTSPAVSLTANDHFSGCGLGLGRHSNVSHKRSSQYFWALQHHPCCPEDVRGDPRASMAVLRAAGPTTSHQPRCAAKLQVVFTTLIARFGTLRDVSAECREVQKPLAL